MQLCGLQKLTLLDFPGRVACTVFTGGCDFRCPFCHNASLVLQPGEAGSVSEEALFSLLQKRRGILEGVCVTGGEPLLQPDLARFLGQIQALGYPVKLDTNGSFPDRLRALVEQGLVNRVAMDLKAGPARYAAVAGVPGLDLAPVRASVAYLLSGAVPYEFRTTVVRGLHTEQDFVEIADWIAGAQAYYLQGFVDSGDLIGSGCSAFSRAEMEHFLALVKPKIPAAELRGVG
jgi:pyruvate formate lyase activating enzyme